MKNSKGKRGKEAKPQENMGSVSELDTEIQDDSNSEVTNSNQASIEVLRALNLELVNDNKEKTIQLGKYVEEHKSLITTINQQSLQLNAYKRQNASCIKDIKALHEKIIMCSQDVVNFIYKYHKLAESSLNSDTTIDKQIQSPVQSKANIQQRAVRPMVSGYTIQKPVINLARVSQEQLERLRYGSSADLVPSTNAEEAPFETDVLEQEEANENASEGSDDEVNSLSLVAEAEESAGHENQSSDEEFEDDDDAEVQNRLCAIAEETEPVNIETSNVDVTMNNLTRHRRPNIAVCPTPTNSSILDDTSVLEDPNLFHVRNMTERSLTDISNTLTEGCITRRRGPPRKRAIDNVDPGVSPRSSTILEAAAIATNASNIELSNTAFMQDLPFSSTPSVASPEPKRARRTRKPLLDRSDAYKNATIRSCSVVLKRISRPVMRKKSLSPNSPTSSTSTGSTLTDTVTISPKGRPRRKARPTNLRETSLRKKMRR